MIHYGDKFYLETSEEIGGHKYYIGSRVSDWTHFSRASHKQLVFSTPDESFACVWTLKSLGREDMDMEGEPYTMKTPILLQNCQTNVSLSANDAHVFNDYGNEYELIGGRLSGRKTIWTIIDH